MKDELKPIILETIDMRLPIVISDINQKKSINVMAEVDTGSHVPIVFPEKIGMELELKPISKIGLYVGMGGVFTNVSEVLVNISLVNLDLKNVKAIITPNISEIIIGNPLLQMIGPVKIIDKKISLSMEIAKPTDKKEVDDDAVVSEFIDLLSLPDINELKIAPFLKNNFQTIFGPEYKSVYHEEKLGLHERTDFLLQRINDYHDIIELKSPQFELFVEKDKRGAKFYMKMSAELKNAISQMMYYLKDYNVLYLSQKEQLGYDVLLPKGIIVIGRTKDDEREAIRVHNSYLNSIQIITYDELLERVRNAFKIYRQK